MSCLGLCAYPKVQLVFFLAIIVTCTGNFGRAISSRHRPRKASATQSLLTFHGRLITTITLMGPNTCRPRHYPVWPKRPSIPHQNLRASSVFPMALLPERVKRAASANTLNPFEMHISICQVRAEFTPHLGHFPLVRSETHSST